jgi:16S rRNA processing protein RimM
MDPLGRLEPFEVTEAKIHRKLIIVQLKDVDHIDRANRLVGASVLVEKASLPELEEGEYYWADLIGMEVTTPTGVRSGKVSGIIPTGGQDVLVITINGEEVLVPATEDVIQRVDVVSRRMVVNLKEDVAGDDTI